MCHYDILRFTALDVASTVSERTDVGEVGASFLIFEDASWVNEDGVGAGSNTLISSETDLGDSENGSIDSHIVCVLDVFKCDTILIQGKLISEYSSGSKLGIQI